MKNTLITSIIVGGSVLAASGADAACRQVYGGTSCNWMGQCWHNPPKTVCDAPPARIAAPPPPQNRVSVQPNTGGRLIGMDGASIISRDGAGLIGQAGGNMRR
jgi:hypothetical protein